MQLLKKLGKQKKNVSIPKPASSLARDRTDENAGQLQPLRTELPSSVPQPNKEQHISALPASPSISCISPITSQKRRALSLNINDANPSSPTEAPRQERLPPLPKPPTLIPPLVSLRSTQLKKSLQRLNKSSERFEKTYASYIRKLPDLKGFDDANITIIFDEAKGASVFDKATAFGKAVTRTLEQRENQQQRKSVTRSIGRFVARLFPLLALLLQVGGSSAQAAACIPAATVLRGTLVILEALIIEKNCPKDLSSSLESVSYQAGRLGNLGNSTVTETIQVKSTDLLTAIVNYYTTCLEVFRRGLFVNTARELFGEGYQTYRASKEGLDTAIKEFDEALWDQMRELILDLSRLGCGTKQPPDLIDWLAPSYWEVIGQLSGHKNRHFEGTLRWLYLMPELNSWLVGIGSPGLLWLMGLPGVGKSIISAHIISTIITERPQMYLLYFFCRDGEEKLRHAQNILQTLSYQLALRDEGFRHELERTRLEDKFTVSPALGIRLLYNRLFQQPLASLSGIEEGDEVYCIIDGLDEANFGVKDDRSGEPELLVLIRLLANTPRVRLLLLSRSVREICDTMIALRSVTREIGAAENKEDIELYVKWKISQSTILQDGFQRLKVDPIPHVCKSANGNFLWVDILLEFLEHSNSVKEFECGLLETPVQFYELYMQILTRLNLTVTSQKRKIVKEIIHMTICAPSEMEIQELQAAVEAVLQDQIFDFPRLLRADCGTFLRVVDDPLNANRKSVRVVHETFREFITSDSSKGEWFHVSIPEGHGEMAFVLLRHLLESGFGPQLTAGKFVRRTELTEIDMVKRFPLLKYASTQWSYHLRHSSTDPLIAEKLYVAIAKVVQYGPLLSWIEALANCQALFVLARTSEDIYAWIRTPEGPFLSVSRIQTLEGWARDIARFSRDYSGIVSDYPNAAHALFFDLFPAPSVFHGRYGNDKVLISDGISVHWNPLFMGPNLNQDYHLSAVSHERKLFALASLYEIRVLDQTSGESVHRILAPGTLTQHNRWAVLAMTFSGKYDLLAAVHVPLRVDETAPYLPELSIWDTEKRVLVASTTLTLQGVASCICLVDRLRFSDECDKLYGGGWEYNIIQDVINAERLVSIEGSLANAQAVVFSPNSHTALKLEANGCRTLVCRRPASLYTFTKPPFYQYEDDNPDNLAPSPTQAGYHWRFKLAPFRWWQLWREVTRSYQFSPDSHWFVRFTEQNDVVLRNLVSQTERVIYRPTEAWNTILLNNIVFDVTSEKLAWTFDHIHIGGGWDTRVETWNVGKMMSSGGFRCGRLWRQRIEFCSNPQYLLTYRMGITIWDIMLGIKLEELMAEERGGSENWTIGPFTPSLYIRAGYFPDGRIFVNYVEECTVNGLVTHVFWRDKGIGRKVSYRSPLQLHSKQYKFPAAFHGNVLALGDTIFELSGDSISVSKTVTIGQVGKEVVCTAFHLASGRMACLQICEDNALVLQLYCTQKNQLVGSTTFASDNNGPYSATIGEDCPAHIIFDESPTPSFIVVLLSERRTRLKYPEGGTTTQSSRIESANETLQIWMFELPTLSKKQTFTVCNYRHRAPEFEWDSTLKCYFSVISNKLICWEARKGVPCAQLWIVDMKHEMATTQFFPDFRELEFTQQSATVVGLTVEGWIQSKKLSDMEIGIVKNGNGRQFFHGGVTIDNWVMEGWEKLAWIPPNFVPCYESGFAVDPRGEVTYIAEGSDHLVQVSLEW